jgi:hypothetical protein
MNEEQSKQQKQKPRWYTPYWIVIFALTIIIGVSALILRQTSLQIGIGFLIVALVAEYVAYRGRVKPSLSLNRFMYILIGVPIGFILWLIVWNISLSAFGRGINEDFILAFGSIAICLLIGGFIGDFIGRLRHYKGPQQYQI